MHARPDSGPSTAINLNHHLARATTTIVSGAEPIAYPLVESRKGAVASAMAASLRFPSPLIKPDVRFARIRLSDWLHGEAHGGAPR